MVAPVDRMNVIVSACQVPSDYLIDQYIDLKSI